MQQTKRPSNDDAISSRKTSRRSTTSDLPLSWLQPHLYLHYIGGLGGGSLVGWSTRRLQGNGFEIPIYLLCALWLLSLLLPLFCLGHCHSLRVGYVLKLLAPKNPWRERGRERETKRETKRRGREEEKRKGGGDNSMHTTITLIRSRERGKEREREKRRGREEEKRKGEKE